MKILLLLAACSLFSCSSNKGTDKAITSDFKPEISLSAVSINNCLNLEKIMSHLKDTRFVFPAAIMTTQLNSLSEISDQKEQYLSYSSFYYKSGLPNELNLINVSAQKNCSTLQLLTSSNEILNFKVTESSDRYLKFELVDDFAPDMSYPKKKALFNRIQPYEYSVTYLSEHSLKIVEKYTSFDPLCLTRNHLNLEVTKILSWGNQASELPQQYNVDATYFNKVKSALINSSDLAANAISVEKIKALMLSPIRDELKLCL